MTKVNSAIGIEYNSHEIKAVELLKKPDGTLEATAFGNECCQKDEEEEKEKKERREEKSRTKRKRQEI